MPTHRRIAVRIHDKLVRDRLPAIIAAGGKRCGVRTLTPEEHVARFTAKLVEETQEFA